MKTSRQNIGLVYYALAHLTGALRPSPVAVHWYTWYDLPTFQVSLRHTRSFVRGDIFMFQPVVVVVGSLARRVTDWVQGLCHCSRVQALGTARPTTDYSCIAYHIWLPSVCASVRSNITILGSFGRAFITGIVRTSPPEGIICMGKNSIQFFERPTLFERRENVNRCYLSNRKTGTDLGLWEKEECI